MPASPATSTVLLVGVFMVKESFYLPEFKVQNLSRFSIIVQYAMSHVGRGLAEESRNSATE